MRVTNHIHIRHIMLYHFKKEMTPTESWRDLNATFGEGTISKRQCYEWFYRFETGDTSLEDKEGRGRPSDFDDNALIQAVEEDESLTTRMLAEQFDVDQSTIVRHLKKLGKVWKLGGWVPHELSDDNKTERVLIFSQLLLRNEEKPFLQYLVTGDESWLLFKNAKRKKVCVDPGQTPKGIPKAVHCKKVLWCVWWDRSGIIHWEILTNGFCLWWSDDDVRNEWRIPDKNGRRQFTLNSDVYLAQLDRLEAAIKVKRPRKKNHIVFQHDNARPHVEGRVVESIRRKG
jgi:histone-lysine N-methyltransferase SETMAR